ncbi:MAG: fatty acid desaturase [Parvularculaceae bacterium]|nr:fatty acid desaturase [Parvularculaceae bacterium]
MTAVDIAAPDRASRRAHVETSAFPVVFMFLVVAGVGAASCALALSGVLPYWAAAAINFLVLYFFAHFNHEAVHGNICGVRTEWRWLNEAVGLFGGFFLLLPLPIFRTVHLAHHRMPNHPELDGDLWMAGRNPLTTFLRCTTLLVGYEIRLWRLVRRGLAPARALWETWAWRGLALVMIAAATAAGYGWEILILWIGPALTVTPLLAWQFAYIVHYPHHHGDPHQASRVLMAKDKRLQPLLTAMFLFQNYHLVHHLNPRAPFYRYGELYRAMEKDLRDRKAAIATVM